MFLSNTAGKLNNITGKQTLPESLPSYGVLVGIEYSSYPKSCADSRMATDRVSQIRKFVEEGFRLSGTPTCCIVDQLGTTKGQGGQPNWCSATHSMMMLQIM